MKKGAIFDLDGTLVSTIGLHESAWKELFKKYNIVLTEQELKEHMGKKNVHFINFIFERRNIENLNTETLSDEKDKIVLDYLKNKPPPAFDGVEEFLTLLQEKGIKLALATSATRETAMFLGEGLIDYFNVKVFAEDVDHGKPNPEIFLKAAEKLGLKNEECVVFEDAKSGIQAAKDGRFFCVAKDNNFGQDLSNADVVIRHYDVSRLIKLFQ